MMQTLDGVDMYRIAAILVLGASVAYSGLAEPELKVELKKADDSAAVTSAHNATVLAITSKSGIGGAKLLRTGAQWPERLTIRLNVKGLESLRIENGHIRLDAAFKRRRQVPYWNIGNNSDRRSRPRDGTLEVDMIKTETSIEIVIPREILDGNPERIGLFWIDFFRG
jgi:hypothetical protein